ncbi:MAG: hypothetical protein ACYDEX_03630 [Mobilitalea sp.]
MGITDYIQRKKSNQTFVKPENITLRKPIVNVFVGDFDDKFLQEFTQIFDKRLGFTEKVNYSCIMFKDSSQRLTNIERIRYINITDCSLGTQYNLTSRKELAIAIDKSSKLEEEFQDYVNDLFNIIARYSYEDKGFTRINIILKAEALEAAGLKQYIQSIKKNFNKYYSEQVIVDVYCIFDQKGYRKNEYGEERSACSYLTLKELNELAEDTSVINMAFLLSNINSKEKLDVDSISDIMTAISMMMIAKDGVSKGDRHRYNDLDFRSDCKRSGRNLYSLGYLKLETVELAMKDIAYKALIDELITSRQDMTLDIRLVRMNMTETDIINKCREIASLHELTDNIFEPMIKNSNTSVVGIMHDTRETSIYNIYGHGLEQFCVKNLCYDRDKLLDKLTEDNTFQLKKFIEDLYHSDHYSVQEIDSLLSMLQEYFEELIKNTQSELQASETDIYNWLGQHEQNFDHKAIHKETKEPSIFYTMANYYVNRRLRTYLCQVKLLIYNEYCELLSKLSKPYHTMVQLLHCASKDLQEEISNTLSNEMKLKAGNFEPYYKQITMNIIKKDVSIMNFIRQFSEEICSGKLTEENIFERIVGYCDDYILTKDCYIQDFSNEMIARLKHYDKFNDDVDIYNVAFDTILDHQFYYISIIGTDELNREICFFVNPKNNFVEQTNARMDVLRSNNRLKLFAEDDFDLVEILYMEGCFDVQTIYLFDNYKEIYERLWKNEKEGE